MTDKEYNDKLDAIALAAMQTILSHEECWLKNSSGFVAHCAYDYAVEMLESRENYKRGNK